MSIEELYPLVTEAIRRAETLEDLQAPGARSAYLDVSLLEERVTECLPASDPEGALARRGAVRAALSANEPARAEHLAERFLAEAGVNDELRSELVRLSEQAEHQLDDLDWGTLTKILNDLKDSNERLRDVLELQLRWLESLSRKVDGRRKR